MYLELSGEFELNVALTQESALSPVSFVAVVEQRSRKIGTKDVLRKLLFVDDLAAVANIQTASDIKERY